MDMTTEKVLSGIMQFLEESGYQSTLSSLQTESGQQYDPSQLERPSDLLNMLMEWKDFKNLLDPCSPSEAHEEINIQGEENYCRELEQTLQSVHPANILCLRFSPDTEKSWIASGSSDKSVKIVDFKTGATVHTFVALFNAAVISLNFNPKQANHLIAGGMDGSHHLLDLSSFSVLQSFHDHKKYVVRVKWSADGSGYATASYDKSVCYYKVQENGTFQLHRRLEFTQNVEALDFTKDSKTLIIAVREDNYLNFVDLSTFNINRRNMNKNQDDHVSFSALDISVSPSGAHLLVATDKDRLIIYSILDSLKLMKNLWGARNDTYSQPRACWDLSGKYVYSTSQDNKIYVWDVVSQKLVSRLQAHTALVRDIDHHPNDNLVCSCSYDKSICLWKSEI